MKAVLQGCWSSDIPEGEPTLPQNPECCWIPVVAEIGTDTVGGADSFTFYVTTPVFLTKLLNTDRVQLGHGLIVMNEFDWGDLYEAVQSIIDKCEADSWEEIVGKISCYGESEFDEYEH